MFGRCDSRCQLQLRVCVYPPGAGVSLHLSPLSTSSSLNSTVSLSLGLLHHPVGSLRHLHSLLFFSFFFIAALSNYRQRSRNTEGDFPGRRRCLAQRQRQHTDLSLSLSLSLSRGRLMKNAWTQLYFTEHIQYDLLHMQHSFIVDWGLFWRETLEDVWLPCIAQVHTSALVMDVCIHQSNKHNQSQPLSHLLTPELWQLILVLPSLQSGQLGFTVSVH